MKENIITFEARGSHVFEVREKPVPAVKLIPQWWKDIPKYSNEENKLDLDPSSTVTVKQCAPTMDALSLGYIITLWADLLVTQVEGVPWIRWKAGQDVLSAWDLSQSSKFEVPYGYSNPAFKYHHGWNILTKPGWSTLFIHPLGYQNLPFNSIPGVVDTDILTTDINCPFFVREGFEGLIPKGTPMVQLIPFKRESWVSDYTVSSDEKLYIESEKHKTKLYGYYSSKRAKKSFK